MSIGCHWPGDELVVSYLGREEFAPAAARQAVLQERYGFRCACPRCSLEQQVPRQLQQMVEQVYMEVMKVSGSASLIICVGFQSSTVCVVEGSCSRRCSRSVWRS